MSQSFQDSPKFLTERLLRDGYGGTLAEYRAAGGYEQWRRAVTSLQPAEIIDLVKDSGLRGRGGAGFPTGLKWSFMPKDSGKPHYLLVNSDESEPGTFKDRLLLEKDPHLVLEGAAISAFAIGARTIYIYVRGEYVYPRECLDRAIQEAYEAGLLGQKLFGTDWSLDIYTHPGAGAYICGEETALMESLEGKRGHPRPKPPFPAGYGAWGQPTTINNVETVANARPILEHGAGAFRSVGTKNSPGTILVGVSGHVNRPGVYELPMGVPVRTVVDQVCGGMRNGKALKAFYVGGSSTGLLPAKDADVTLDHDAVRERGVMLGTAGLIVMDEDTSIIRATRVLADFYDHETCGQCSQCRVGMEWSYQIIRRIEEGRGHPSDLKTFADLIQNFSGGKTICAFADGAAMPFKTALLHFREEWEEAIRRANPQMADSPSEEPQTAGT
ncbi:MAG: NADH-quinone oxidoreductase subunit NuoF [Planctomycetota bacterium]|nr:MAG: NADH-quinone oxidoreductase subunit NuoF [Planctomycetota bacterium]